jgi:Sulfotransferase family
MPCESGTTTTWSAYDDAMPQSRRSDLPVAAATFAALRAVPEGQLPDLTRVSEVVVVVASSRGGSTLVGELLRRTPVLLSLRAEINPLFVVAGLEPPVAEQRRTVLARELAAEIGRPAPTLPPEDVAAFGAALAWRLTAQWPDAGIDPSDVTSWTAETLRELAAEDPAWTAPAFPDAETFHLRLLRKVRRAHPAVNPWYYDISAEAVRGAFPGVPRPDGPPNPHLVEMPPFVLIRPWRRPSPAELDRDPLVLSTPRNAFRLSFLRSLFPRARLRVVHLTRNPAASANGLIDGWRHHGFFNTAVEERLRIAGYSDDFPGWGTNWWNYDFWPGWMEWTDAPLTTVAAEQWRSHHDEVLRWLAGHDVDHYRLRFEDVVGADAVRRRALGEFGDWLGHGDAADSLSRLSLPPLMATAPPRPRRWSERATDLIPAVTTPRMLEIATRLGYEDPSGWQ